jgi:hypothetical protein
MKLLPMRCLLFYVFVVMVTSPHASAEIQGSEANTLLRWKSSFDNQSQALLSSWNIGNNPESN